MVNLPIHISLLFIALVFIIAFFFIVTVYVYSKRAQLSDAENARNVVFSIVVIFSWLIFTLILTQTGFLEDYTAMPPHIMAVVLPPLLIIAVLLFSKKFMRLVQHVDQFWLIYPQSFRIVMELILWLLYRYGVIPVQMTFEGRNFDVLAGITAPFVAYYCFRRKTWPTSVAVVWNVLSLLLLLNIVITAILSTPYPFRYFMNEPANTVIFHFPLVWLPGFVVPFAFFLHLLSLSKLLRKQVVT